METVTVETAGVEFVKGHGTENDFVLLPDPSGALDLTDELVRTLCDRRRGLGADGVLRVARTDTPAARAAGADPGDAEWFMDYRNADGSVAEMCGNGVRVFARYLVSAGLAAPGVLPVATRAGVRTVTLGTDGDVTVDMGPARLGPASAAVVAGRPLPGVVVDVGNPHLACVIASDVDALDLSVPPSHDPAVFPHGANVEFLTPPVDGVVRLRVHERGSGETRSCGTGTVAGAVAALAHLGETSGELVVETPGGRLAVTVSAETTTLRGPAVLVARGWIDDDVVKPLLLVEP